MELLLPIQELLANLLFHRFNLMGEMRGTAVLQAHTVREAQVLPSQGGIQDAMQLVQDGRRASIQIVGQEDYRQEEKKKKLVCTSFIASCSRERVSWVLCLTRCSLFRECW